jgi:hypothetical protein
MPASLLLYLGRCLSLPVLCHAAFYATCPSCVLPYACLYMGLYLPLYIAGGEPVVCPCLSVL